MLKNTELEFITPDELPKNGQQILVRDYCWDYYIATFNRKTMWLKVGEHDHIRWESVDMWAKLESVPVQEEARTFILKDNTAPVHININ